MRQQGDEVGRITERTLRTPNEPLEVAGDRLIRQLGTAKAFLVSYSGFLHLVTDKTSVRTTVTP